MRCFLLVFILMAAGITSVVGQSRSNLGIGYAFTKPYSGDYNFSSGVFVQGDIAILNNLAITSDIGYNRINSKTADAYNPVVSPIANFDLYHLGLSLKYDFNRNWYIAAGGMFYMAQGGDDTVGIGAGGLGEIGYNLNLDKKNTLAFSFNTMVINITSYGNGVTPIASIKAAYKINFKGY